MKRWIILCWHKDSSKSILADSVVVDSVEALLAFTVQAIRNGRNISVYEIGECVGDFS